MEEERRRAKKKNISMLIISLQFFRKQKNFVSAIKLCKKITLKA
jgi:hypothetical protein